MARCMQYCLNANLALARRCPRTTMVGRLTPLTTIPKTRRSTLFSATSPCQTNPSKLLRQFPSPLPLSTPHSHHSPPLPLPLHPRRCSTSSLAFRPSTGFPVTTLRGRVPALTSSSRFCRPVLAAPRTSPLSPAHACAQYPCDYDLEWCIKSWYVTLDDGAIASDPVKVNAGKPAPDVACSPAHALAHSLLQEISSSAT